MLQGQQSWAFLSRPVILASATAVGPCEGKGAQAGDFDILHDDFRAGQESYEKAEKKLLEDACHRALENE